MRKVRFTKEKATDHEVSRLKMTEDMKNEKGSNHDYALALVSLALLMTGFAAAGAAGLVFALRC